MATDVDEEAMTRFYDSSSEDEDEEVATPPRQPSPEVESDPQRPAFNDLPVHPVACFQGAFEESIIESIEQQTNPQKQVTTTGDRSGLQDTTDERGDEHERSKQQAKYHPLWKLMAQISFGVHLLQKHLAKSDEEVTKILQKHVDEVDAFLDRTMKDFDLSHRDINERTTQLRLPLEHITVFELMLDDTKFRADIIEGNQKIERVVARTARAMIDALKDASKGIEAVTELSAYLRMTSEKRSGVDDRTWDVHNTMKGNAEGWLHSFGILQAKGKDLDVSLARLGSILTEVDEHAGAASRRAALRQAPNAEYRFPRSPISKFSTAHIANFQGKPLPPPPQSGTSSPVRLEMPSMLLTWPESHDPSPDSPLSTRSAALRSNQEHSPLGGSAPVQSPPAGPSQQTSPANTVQLDPTPFESKFENSRSPPKPPSREQPLLMVMSDPSDEASEEISALPQYDSSSPHMDSPTLVSRSNSTLRSNSLMKRLRRNASRSRRREERSSDRSQSRSSSRKHERSMTSDLADLFRFTGISEARSNSWVDVQSKLMGQTSTRSSDALGNTLSRKAIDRSHSHRAHSPRRAGSARSDSAYSSGDGEKLPETKDTGRLHRHKSLDRFLGDQTLTGSRHGPHDNAEETLSHHRRYPLTGVQRPISPPQQDDDLDLISQSVRTRTLPLSARPASPISLAQPSVGSASRPHTPVTFFSRPQTPAHHKRFGLFPSRPKTPGARSYVTDGSPQSSRRPTFDEERTDANSTRARSRSNPSGTVFRFARSRTRSNASTPAFKTGDLVGGAAIIENKRMEAEEGRSGGFGRLKDWVTGKKKRSHSSPREIW